MTMKEQTAIQSEDHSSEVLPRRRTSDTIGPRDAVDDLPREHGRRLSAFPDARPREES